LVAGTFCRGGQAFGAGGVVTGGGNSFTFIQSNSKKVPATKFR